MTNLKPAAQQNSVRIIAGKWRGKKLPFPNSNGLRPTANRVRETLFNWLQTDITGANCLDLFAGSGACGIEALSRGAARVSFIENSREASTALTKNLLSLSVTESEICHMDAILWLKHQSQAADAGYNVVFVDPPYADNLAYDACQLLQENGLLLDHAKIYLEMDSEIDLTALPRNWRLLKMKKAGTVNYCLMGAENRNLTTDN